MLKKLALALAAIVAVLVVVVAIQPSSFAIERSLAIAAPPAIVYPHIANLRAMNAWSPWVKMDPQMKIVYEGAESGVGARSAWKGPQMGEGRLAITSVKPDREIEMRLEMLTPMAATNRVVFSLVPAEDATLVTWRMEGRNGFIAKAVSLVLGMDEMVGRPFEQGLAELKTLAESDANDLTRR